MNANKDPFFLVEKGNEALTVLKKEKYMIFYSLKTLRKNKYILVYSIIHTVHSR